MNETQMSWTPGKWKAFRKPRFILDGDGYRTAGHDPDRWVLKSDIELYPAHDGIACTTIHFAEIHRCGEMADEEVAANAHLIAAAPSLYEALEAYSRWEADLIMSNEAWSGGFAELPTITQELWDRFIEIQGMRNAALALAKGETK